MLTYFVNKKSQHQVKGGDMSGLSRHKSFSQRNCKQSFMRAHLILIYSGVNVNYALTFRQSSNP